jgi:DNA-binding NarL/FixJ family response regulator
MTKAKSLKVSHTPISAKQIDASYSEANSSNSSAGVRILLVDDHAVIRAGLRMLIENRKGFTIVGEAKNRAEAVEIATCHRPNIILLDVDLSAENGLDFLPDLLTATENQAKIILLTGVSDVDTHARAVRMGALGVVLKDSAPEVLLKAIEKVHQGEVWLERSMVATALSACAEAVMENATTPKRKRIATITEREHEVIALIGEGLRNQQIADKLFISEATVRRHLSSIFLKLEVSDRLDLVVYAFQHGIINPSR